MRRRVFLALTAVGGGSLCLAPGLSWAAEAKKKGGGLTYLQFPTLTATVIRPSGRRGVLTVEAGLDVADGGLRNRASQSVPRLRDAYGTWLLNYAAGMAPGTAPNADAIGAALQRATDEVLGRPGARLLLGAILVN